MMDLFSSQRCYSSPASSSISSSNTNMAIEAGRGVGPFTIGMDVGAALVIASQYEESPHVVIDRSNPFLVDTLLDLPSIGFRLCFDGYSQRLHVIIINTQPVLSHMGTPRTPNGKSDVLPTTTHIFRSVLNFSFNGIPLIRSSRYLSDLRHIYRICGPTIPGHYSEESRDQWMLGNNAEPNKLLASTNLTTVTPPKDGENDSSRSVYYFLKYPGVAFRFPIPTDDYESLKSTDEDLLPFVLPVSSSTRGLNGPVVDRLFVFSSDSILTDPRNPPWISPKPILPAVAPNIEPIESTEEESEVLEEHNIPSSLVPKRRSWNIQVVLREGIRFPWGGFISFGAALQDVYSEVGAPDRVTLKDVDVVGIMSRHADFKTYIEGNDEELTSKALGFTTGNSRPDAPADYFCNYFSKGFDFLICSTTHRLKKIVLHTNFPGHVQFGDYSRCFFSIGLKGNAAIDIDSSWSDIENYLGTPSPPLLVDYPREVPLASDRIGQTVRKFYGYPGMALEVFDKKWIVSVTLF